MKSLVKKKRLIVISWSLEVVGVKPLGEVSEMEDCRENFSK